MWEAGAKRRPTSPTAATAIHVRQRRSPLCDLAGVSHPGLSSERDPDVRRVSMDVEWTVALPAAGRARLATRSDEAAYRKQLDVP